MVKNILLVLILFSAVQSFGKLNSIGLYAGFGSDKQSNPYDFRMKPVFELGAVYNQPLFFNLSMVLDLEFDSPIYFSN